MQNRSFRSLTASLALAAAALTACSESTGTGHGTLRLAITDAPFPFDSVARADVYVVRIDAKLAEAGTQSETDRGIDDERAKGERDGEGWVTLATPNQAINLLELRNGALMNLGEQSLATGTYRGFRLVIDPARSSVTLKNGTQPPIVWPSAARTGIKVKLERPIEVVEGETLMVIDFDLAGSFVMRGHSISRNGLLFKPVVRGVAQDIAGSIGGTVRAGTASGAAVSGASVQLWRQLADTAAAEAVALATAGTDAEGGYKLSALTAGTYALRVVPPVGSGSRQAVVERVTVTTGSTTTADVVLP